MKKILLSLLIISVLFISGCDFFSLNFNPKAKTQTDVKLDITVLKGDQYNREPAQGEELLVSISKYNGDNELRSYDASMFTDYDGNVKTVAVGYKIGTGEFVKYCVTIKSTDAYECGMAATHEMAQEAYRGGRAYFEKKITLYHEPY